METSEPEPDITSTPLPKHQCTMCPKHFVRKPNLDEHILNKHTDNEQKSYRCKDCFTSNKKISKYFATQSILNKHIKRAHGPPRFKCSVCFKTFVESSNFTKHQLRHNQQKIDKIFKCDLCPKSFQSKQALYCHLFNKHGQKIDGIKYYKCELCPREYTDKWKLENHVMAHHVVDKEFECYVCSRSFIDAAALEKHIKVHDSKMKYSCDVCFRGFKRKAAFIHHLGVQHKRFFFCGKMCLRSFRNKSDFDEHVSDSKQELRCYVCQEIINSECNLKIHTDSHVKKIKSEVKEIKVENQIEHLEEATELIKHEPTMNSETSFQCELCSKTFDREDYINTHRKIVHQNAEWTCNFEQCSKTFKLYNQLRVHQMTHSKTKQFKCDTCRKEFYLAKSLRDHEKTHLQVKECKCEMCPKSFTTRSRLKIHVANNHGGFKPFQCPVKNCESSWASRNELNAHLVSHQTEKLFKCEACVVRNISFKTLKQLKQHHRVVHLNFKRVKKQIESKKPTTLSAMHSDSAVFICRSIECSFETTNEKEVAIHYSQQHQLPKVLLQNVVKIENIITNPRKIIQIQYKCKICSKLFNLRSTLWQHQQVYSGSDYSKLLFKCCYCPKQFLQKRNSSRHVRQFHSK